MYIKGKYLLGGLHDISECLAVRREVFGDEEQFLTAASKDSQDSSAIFVLAYETGGLNDQKIVGTGRLIFLGDHYKINRVAVRKEYRGKKYGDFIVRMLLDKAVTMGAKEVYADVPEQIVPFYEQIGFVSEEKEHYEDGICHLLMKLSVSDYMPPCAKS